MPKKSVRENKTVYQTAREEAGLTREKASSLIEFMSPSMIEKIEYGQSKPDPDEVLAMAKAYKNPGLCNYYCSHECSIGNRYVREVTMSDLSQIVLRMLASLNAMENEKNRLIEISVDGKITEEELKDFARIQNMVNQISMAADAMNLWLEKNIAAGDVDQSTFEEIRNKLTE